MRKVKAHIIRDLFKVLKEANLADVKGENDLFPAFSQQDSLYGHIAEALKLLAPGLYEEFYCSPELPTIERINDYLNNF